MERAIVGFHQDDRSDWVAELSCGHTQHVRHRPPFQQRPWVVTASGRAARTGTPLDCPLCDRAELPDTARPVRSSPTWDEQNMPAGLRRTHRLGRGTWGRLVVHRGRLQFTAATSPPIDVVLAAGATRCIPPEVDHHVVLGDDARFHIDFYSVVLDGRDEGSDVRPPAPPDDTGGDPACWAGLVCPVCGGVIGDRGHRADCHT